MFSAFGRSGRALIAAAIVLVAVVSPAAAFNFTVDPKSVTQCGPTKFNWSGGRGPFTITATSVWARPYAVSVPMNATQNGVTSFDWELPFPNNVQVSFYISDSTGNATGPPTQMYTVGSPQQDAVCNVAPAGPDCYFFVMPDNNTLPQCGHMNLSYGFSTGQTVAPPVTFWGVIPGGDVFTFKTDNADMWTMWEANMAVGTDFILFSTDALGRSGGSSKVQTVVGGDDKCMGPNSPSYPPHGSGAIQANATSASKYQAPKSGSSSSLSGGVIAGIVVGCVVGVGLILGAVLFFLCKRRKAAAKGSRGTSDRSEGQGPTKGAVDLHEPIDEPLGHDEAMSAISLYVTHEAGEPLSAYGSRNYSFDPISSPDAQSSGGGSSRPAGGSGGATNGRYSSLKQQLAAQQHRADAGSNSPLLLHQDAGRLERQGEDEPVRVEELPPTYNPDWDGSTDAGTGARDAADAD